MNRTFSFFRIDFSPFKNNRINSRFEPFQLNTLQTFQIVNSSFFRSQNSNLSQTKEFGVTHRTRKKLLQQKVFAEKRKEEKKQKEVKRERKRHEDPLIEQAYLELEIEAKMKKNLPLTQEDRNILERKSFTKQENNDYF